MDAWLEEFIAYIRYERNYSELTIVSYGSSLKAFELYYKSLDNGLSWDAVTSDVIRSWIVALLEGGISPAGVCPKLSAVKSFYRFLLKRGMIAVDPAYGVNSPKKSSSQKKKALSYSPLRTTSSVSLRMISVVRTEAVKASAV